MGETTLEDRLSTLVNCKLRIMDAIIEKGVSVPTETPFIEYGDLIELIGTTPETTDTQDLLRMVDLYHDLGTYAYNEHTYTTEEIETLDDLITFILEGGTSNE